MEKGRQIFGRMRTASRPLTWVGLAMLPVFILSVVGIFANPRIITGVAAWLKPAKFAISSAIYSLTLAWVFTHLTERLRMARAMGWITAVMLALEVAIIDVQAARGTTSHFNASTPLDQVLFGIMGVSIGLLWLASIAIAVGLFRQRFRDPALGAALRSGMLITVLGTAVGGLMLRPTGAQLEAARTTHHIVAVGAHTVGAADGGPGLPGVGWSRQHGDLRVPHFFGLHALQLVPLLAWLLTRLRGLRPERRVRMVITAAASYASLLGILIWQALRGQSVIAPDALSVAAIAVWLAATLAIALFGFWRPLGSQEFLTGRDEDRLQVVR